MKYETELCKIAHKYGTDKCPQIKHSFTPFYYSFLKDKNIKTVLELGIGEGGSLRMWKEFFPNAKIYGVDNQEARLITEDGIETFLCDGTNEKEVLEVLQKIGTDIDLFIDDGSHIAKDQIRACKLWKPLLKNTIYIIEDVTLPDTIIRELSDYKVFKPELKKKGYRDNRILVIE